VVHGAGEAVEPGGMFTLETFGAYIVARCYIRKLDDFVATARLLALIVSIMLPLGAAELITGQKLILEVFRGVLPTIVDAINEPRWGLTRVQGPFEHPILFGVFCSGAVALTHLVLAADSGQGRRWTMTSIVAATAFLSLSSGPIAILLVQLGLICWNWMLGKVRARWRILWVIGVFAYCVAELSSTQSVPQLLTRFAFDPWTAFYRLLIWEYGMASVMANPMFGTGFNDWIRPAWMPPSIDMFWLLPAVRHGLPAGIFLLMAFFAAVLAIAFKPCDDKKVLACRTAYLIAMTGFFLVGWTVHFWNATYVLFTFLLGSGMWILDEPEADATTARLQARRAARTSHRQTPSRIRMRSHRDLTRRQSSHTSKEPQ